MNDPRLRGSQVHESSRLSADWRREVRLNVEGSCDLQKRLQAPPGTTPTAFDRCANGDERVAQGHQRPRDGSHPGHRWGDGSPRAETMTAAAPWIATDCERPWVHTPGVRAYLRQGCRPNNILKVLVGDIRTARQVLPSRSHRMRLALYLKGCIRYANASLEGHNLAAWPLRPSISRAQKS